jgi:hypothetical protein
MTMHGHASCDGLCWTHICYEHTLLCTYEHGNEPALKTHSVMPVHPAHPDPDPCPPQMQDTSTT